MIRMVRAPRTLLSGLCVRCQLSCRLLSESTNGHIVDIGGVRKRVTAANRSELVPQFVELANYQAVLKALRWMLQKDQIGQDMFLIGPPGPLRRLVCLKFLEITQREMEYVALSRDTTESDLKQRREIRSATAQYIDQAAVRAAIEGRVLLLDGIEKAERNVLPVLNNLLENREMQLEDGRFLLSAARYDELLEERSQQQLQRWQLERVSEHFRVIALGLPVPRYTGNPLDPPLRSRFQSYHLRSSDIDFKEHLETLQALAPSVSSKSLCDLLSFALTVNSTEARDVLLPDFPIELLLPLARAMNSIPVLPASAVVSRVYPHHMLLTAETRRPVEETMSSYDLFPPGEPSSALPSETPMTLISVSREPGSSSQAQVKLSFNGEDHMIKVPCGDGVLPSVSKSLSQHQESMFVSTEYHEHLLAALTMSHAVHDFCLVGPRGFGKSAVIRHLATLLGYRIEPVVLYQDMTARDLLQQRTTAADTGDTEWILAPLVTAALHGRMVVLDGIHRVHAGTLNILHRLVHDRELQLFDGRRLLRHDRFDKLLSVTASAVDVQRLPASQQKELAEKKLSEQGLLRIHPSFRIVALAEPPIVGTSSKGQWLTSELMSLFMIHQTRPLSHSEELHLITTLCGEVDSRLQQVLKFTHSLRISTDANSQSLAKCLSTRQLIRIARRMRQFAHETPHQAINKACMTRFLPSMARQTLEECLHRAGIQPAATPSGSDANYTAPVCRVQNDLLTIGRTSARVFNAGAGAAKVPSTLFYNIDQHVWLLEAILEDFLLGEHILLMGNQGVGKNKLVDRFLHLLNRPREYLQLHRDTTVQSLTQQPTVREGRVVFEDSALVSAVKLGRVLVVDEADKAPTHVTCILKTLTEDGEMVLADGRRIQRGADVDTSDSQSVIPIHPDFRLIVLANRPGFPFLGNDFFAALGDLFSCHAIDNPSRESERVLLKQYGPDVPDETIEKVVACFAELRALSDEGTISYPYSTREAVSIIKHLQQYPDDGLAPVVDNVFAFDSYQPEVCEAIMRVLHRHGIPVGSRPDDVFLAKQFRLDSAVCCIDWRVCGDSGRRSSRLLRVPMTPAASEVRYSGPYRYQPRHTAVVCTNTRGSGFSELCWHAQIPLEPDERVSDLITAHVGSDDEETVFASTSNPAGLYSMGSGDSWVTYYPLYYQMNADRYDSCVKMAPLCGEMEGKIVCHEEQTNRLLLVDTASSTLWRMETEGVMSSVLTSARGIISRSMAQDNQNKRWKLNTGLCDKNVLVLYEVDGCRVCVLNMNDGRAHHFTLPHSIANINPLSEQDWLVEAHQQDDITPSRFLYSVSTSTEEVVLRPITEDKSAPDAARLPRVTSSACESMPSGADLITAAGGSLPQASFDFRLLSASGYQAAVLAMPSGLAEGKDNGTSQGPDHWRVIGWRRPGGTGKVAKGRSADLHRHRGSSPPLLMSHTGQVVNVLNMDEIPMEFRHQVALGHPSLTSYLELVNLPSQTVKYLPVTSGVGGGSIPPRDWRVMVARHENGGVYTIDTAGRLSQWETESVTLEQSLDEWRRAVGAEADLQITYDRDTVDDVSSPKHGKHDPTNAPHVGGNMWAGGTGGRDTAGLGGLGGPYRLDAGHHVHQVPEQAKATIPEHIKQAAREMNRKTFEERLRQIQMSEHDAKLYQQICGNVKSQIQSLRVILTGLQAKDKERLWMKNQTSGELDDAKIIEGLTGERSVYKRRGNLDPEMGAPQEKPKLLRLVTDVSGSMYRFNGYDGRLDRMIEVVAMVMEAFAGFEDKFRYDVIGHSGEDYRIAFVKSSRPPTNEKERLQVLKTMRAHSQFCMSGDSTLEATAHAVDTADTDGSDETFVIVLSDANLERYGIPAERLGQVMVRDDQVNVSAVFLGSLGDQADRMRSKLPAGSSFVCLDVDRLPRILQSVFTSGILN